MSFRRFNHLNVPEYWERYFTKYPQGMTILESLFEWVSQVDSMVDNQNKLNTNVEQFRKEINEFVGRFDERLQTEVTHTLNDWQNSGFLDVVISDALQWQLDDYITTNEQDKLSIAAQLTETVKKDSLFVSVKDYGAKGDGVTDDTQSIQDAFNSGFHIRFPQGTYLTDKNLSIKSNSVIDFTGSIIIRKPTSEIGYKILDLSLAENVTLISPTLIGEKDEHLGTEGQWGHGIDTGSSKNITISNPTISNCWGDGIYIGRNSGSYLPENINIIGVANITNCRRQGISVVGGKKLFIDSLIARNIVGSPPGAGLDIEPNSADDHVELVVNSLTVSNATYGLLSIIPSERVDVTIHNVTIIDCETPINIRTDETGESPNHGSINLGNVVINGVSNRNPIIVENNFIGFSPKIIIDNVTVLNWIISDINSNVVWTGVLRFYITRQSTLTNDYGDVTIGTIKVNDFVTNKSIRPFIVSTNINSNDHVIKNIRIDTFLSDDIENTLNSSSSVKMEDVSIAPSTPNYYKLMNDSTHIGEGFNFRKYSLSTGSYVISDTFKFAHLLTTEPFINLSFTGGSNKKTIVVNGVTVVLSNNLLKLSNTKNKIIVFIQHNNQIMIDYESRDIGGSSGRPVMTNDDVGGFSYFDRSLNKPIWWTGSNWVDATGGTV